MPSAGEDQVKTGEDSEAVGEVQGQGHKHLLKGVPAILKSKSKR